MPTVLVTDADRGSAVAVIRSLGRRGWRVIAAGPHPLSAGLHSRYAAERLCYPHPRRAPEGLLEVLHRRASEGGVDLIVPVTDDVALPLAAARDRFAGVCALALPADAQLHVATDKLATLELAAELGVPVPRTLVAATADEAVAQAGLLDWPVVVKPRRSRASGPAGALEAFTVSYAADADQLAAQVATLEGRVPALLQEHCPGEGVGVEVLMLDGRPLAAFQHRRLREVPPSGGASALRESVALDPVLLGHTVRLLGALGWTGLAMAEFKVGRAGARLMEVNGRIWGSLALAVRSGMDFPARLADVLTGNGDRVATSFDGDYAVGVRSRDLELELRWIGTVLRGVPPLAATASPSRRDALRVAAALVHPADGYDVLSAADPWPGAAEAATLVARGIRALRRRHVGAGR